MKGAYEIEISTKKIRYKFNINRKITIIRGNSGTGKTTICNLINDSMINKMIKIKSKIKVNTDRGYYNENFPENLINSDNNIIFLDENSILFKYKGYEEVLKKSGNYFVIISRDKFKNLPYSYKEIYEIIYDESEKTNYMKRLYKDYDSVENAFSIYNEDRILVEDSNSGYILYKNIYSNNRVISSKGNSNIIKYLNKRENYIIIADGAAIGSEMDDILSRKTKNSKLYLPESIEYIILNSKIFEDSINNKIDEIMENPPIYIDSREYFSWETFFTNLLTTITNESKYPKYDKSYLNRWYLNVENRNKIKNI